MPNLQTIPVAPAARVPGSATGSPPAPAAAIPGETGLSFTIGQDARGCWVALESHGIAGGLFRNRADALHYADREIRRGTGEVRFASGPVAFTVGR